MNMPISHGQDSDLEVRYVKLPPCGDRNLNLLFWF